MTDGALESFEAHRPSMIAIAYRMLGSVAEAEDIVQEAWLRWEAAGREDVRSDRAFLSTVVTRLCLDRLKSAQVTREQYVGPWLPEPVRTDTQVDSESISLAFLVLLESLSPVERAVYLLHEVFGYSHSEVAEMVGKEEAACRQILHRARDHIRTRRPRFAPSKESHERLVTGFMSACLSGDLEGLKNLLAHDVTSWADGGGKVRGASRNPVHGADAVARLFLGIMKKAPAGIVPEFAEVNGWPGLVLRWNGAVFDVISFETDGAHIHAIRSVLNPDKLARI
ncbi:RNA polymerase sigma-70 factor [Vitiosangium sp. GDMCC 1.1324]|uniref:RNA polymerase sigma-70 factor n=1 Tax=Vitiosangium sp. (strain GDMCC 1.1324) TaxID=2138576 RepID=UPI000D3381B0|nr:RNA polymerase sigma-70 factor [Vitiosangium sp. GDMCC 1.1324]PTL83397.1 RNA polymerase sigma-70 factor [Vitiosangium sp. GDMCC 1.1324]